MSRNRLGLLKDTSNPIMTIYEEFQTRKGKRIVQDNKSVLYDAISKAAEPIGMFITVV